MARFEGSLAHTLDFGEGATPMVAPARAGLRLASADGLLRGADKYKALEKRRRQAQINARRALNLIDMMEGR